MITRKVAEFVETWKGKGDEKQDTRDLVINLKKSSRGSKKRSNTPTANSIY